MIWRLMLVLELLISATRGQFAVRFDKAQYTFPESGTVCVSVRHVGGPAPQRFSFSYTFDVSLIGLRSGGPLQGTQLFKEGKSTITFCLGEGGGRDNAVCESDTHGSITLINSSAIRLVEPYMTRITITDDEFVFASFSQPSYTFTEGAGNQNLQLSINSVLARSINFQLTPDPVLEADGPLYLLTTELAYQSTSRSDTISIGLRDNSLALEPPQVVSLGVVLSSSECYDLTIAPTLITIIDNDVVKLGFTENKVTVQESEGEVELCVSISHTIARPLNFIIVHNFIVAANQARGGSIFGQLPAYSNSSGRCLTVQFLRDDIVGNDRSFTASLNFDHDTYPNGVTISNPSLTVFIRDTSTCYTVVVENSTIDLVEIPPNHSVCFQCVFGGSEGSRESDVSWKIGVLVLRPDVGEVLSNGTLQVTNSSNVFHKSRLVPLTCSSSNTGQEYTFPVLLQGGEVLVEVPTSLPNKSSHSSSLPTHRSLNHYIFTSFIVVCMCFLSLRML